MKNLHDIGKSPCNCPEYGRYIECKQPHPNYNRKPVAYDKWLLENPIAPFVKDVTITLTADLMNLNKEMAEANKAVKYLLEKYKLQRFEID